MRFANCLVNNLIHSTNAKYPPYRVAIPINELIPKLSFDELTIYKQLMVLKIRIK